MKMEFLTGDQSCGFGEIMVLSTPLKLIDQKDPVDLFQVILIDRAFGSLETSPPMSYWRLPAKP